MWRQPGTLQLKDLHDEEDFIAFGNDFFDRSAKAKRRYERQWLLNIAFLAGNQLVKVNRHTGKLDRIQTEYDPDWIIRIVDNRILPIYRTLMAKLTKNKPMPSAKAHSREESDIQAARAAIKLEEYHWNQLKLDELHPEMVSWLVTTGNAFYKQFWNPKKGERIIDLESTILKNMDTEAGLTEQGLPRLKPGSKNLDIRLGDTDLLLRTPFNIYPQPGKKKLQEMTMIGDAEIMETEDVYNLYGVEVPAEKDSRLIALDTNLESAINSGRADEKGFKEPVTVKELYILPCERFPQGIVFRWAGSKLLGEPEPKCPELPFVHFGLISIPGQFWKRGIIDDVIPLQRRWNALLSKIEMHNDYYNDPPILVDTNIVDIDEWDTEPGKLIPAEGMAGQLERAIHVVQVPQLDTAVLRELEILDQQFEIVPVLNKVSFGKDTPNAKSGIAINFLQEKDDDVVRPLIDNIESGYAEVFRRDFKLCQEHYEEDRGFAIVGEDNKVEWIEFKKADLEANIDVGVEPGSAMPRSRVAQQAMVMDMLKAGFFTDPRTGRPDFAKALKYMEFGSVDDIYQDNALDSNQAQRENEKMKDGVPVTPEDWHNHEAHIYEHNRLRKTADFEQLPDEIRQLFAQHIAIHLEFMKPPASPNPTPATEQPAGNIQGPIPGVSGPSPDEIAAFLQFLQQTRPDIIVQLQQMPPEQRNAAILELMAQMGGEKVGSPA